MNLRYHISTRPVTIGAFDKAEVIDFETLEDFIDDVDFIREMGVQPSMVLKANIFTVVGHLFEKGYTRYLQSVYISDNICLVTLVSPEYNNPYCGCWSVVHLGNDEEVIIERELPDGLIGGAKKRKFSYSSTVEALKGIDKAVNDIETKKIYSTPTSRKLYSTLPPGVGPWQAS